MTLPDASVNKNLEGPGLRASIQRFGGKLAGMIMPNIGAFIAWGLITAMFIEVGWFPNATLAGLVGPMLYFLLPLLIGYTGGRMVHATRGAVIGAVATFGVIMGGITDFATLSGAPMLLGAMIMGPLAAYLLKKFDTAIEGRVKAGFEMVIDNFSLGILGLILAVLGTLGVGPIMTALMAVLSGGVGWLVDMGLLPLASIFVEPAKVLFLNNAINHGIFTPLAALDVQEAGKSILFMVESNPGSGLGLLVAFMLFGPKSMRPATGGAVVIHFFGGIHEIYFPYILMRPVLILATIAGSVSGLFVGTALGAGLVGPASPGSIMAYFLVTPPGGHLAMLATVFTAAGVSFIVAAALLKFGRGSDDTAEIAAAAAASASGQPGGGSSIAGGAIRKIVIACDAGMGSSVMVAGQLKKKLAPFGVEVIHTPVDEIPADTTVVLTQDGLAGRAAKRVPDALIVPFKSYLGDPAFDRVEQAIREGRELTATGLGEPTASSATATPEATPAPAPRKRRAKRLEAGVLPRENVRLGLKAVNKDDAIRQAGQVLVEAGAAEPGYIEGMLARELQTTTYLGQGVSIPHGTNEARQFISKAALGFLQFPDGIDWDGETVHVVIPIASNSNEHVGILSALATTLSDSSKSERLRVASSADEVLALLIPEQQED
ncbi:PTS system, mannitol-specific IIC component [Tessaracoccus bendigoensis DSM 12906]|uniref:Mannitol-specific phosphotransferase enzyme IIA component n=1 Tax=Tessaracoccus bendigoensis DSM 12906 TaxID=1123357 RepID=A0A1M6AAB8_9ACTN|nr:PTS mannitol transporter subunit IICBA [Tessaracoccus bendigoensis]SHI33425.1 PTS system, mannitol-specific IIC component [Tessaracoccus bendigoensis DSM 12906]